MSREQEQSAVESSAGVPTTGQPTQFWGQPTLEGRVPEGATEGRLPDEATPSRLPEQAMPGISSSLMGTGSTTPSHVTDDSPLDTVPSHIPEAPAPAPTPSPSYLPTSPTSVTSPTALNHMDSHRSTRSTESTGSNGNLAVAQSKEQSRQLLEKASQKLASLLVNANDKNFDAARRPGEAAIRRAPQVSFQLLARKDALHKRCSVESDTVVYNAALQPRVLSGNLVLSPMLSSVHALDPHRMQPWILERVK